MATVEAPTDMPEQVLVFALGEDDFCVAIEWVDEIVKPEEVSSVPDMPPMVEGVMDLRGNTTTIVDPKVTFGLAETDGNQQVIIFDTDGETSVGWLVDYAYRVRDFEDPEIEAVEDNRYIEGILTDGDEFTLWVNPERVNSELT